MSKQPLALDDRADSIFSMAEYHEVSKDTSILPPIKRALSYGGIHEVKIVYSIW